MLGAPSPQDQGTVSSESNQRALSPGTSRQSEQSVGLASWRAVAKHYLLRILYRQRPFAWSGTSRMGVPDAKGSYFLDFLLPTSYFRYIPHGRSRCKRLACMGPKLAYTSLRQWIWQLRISAPHQHGARAA